MRLVILINFGPVINIERVDKQYLIANNIVIYLSLSRSLSEGQQARP